MSISSRYLLSGLILGLILVGGAVFVQASKPYVYQGSLIDPPVPAAEIDLVDQQGRPFRLSDQRDQVIVLFFGYTHCSDVCPATLAGFQQIAQRMGEHASQIKFLFITVDPERDTPEALQAYLANFSTPVTGLTGDPAALQAVYQSYGVYVEKQAADNAGGYEVDHTTRTYVVDRAGKLRLTYSTDYDNDQIVQDLTHLIAEKAAP